MKFSQSLLAERLVHKICFTIVETAEIFLVRILVGLILLENLQVRWLAFSGGLSVVVLTELFADYALILRLV
jgi:hypothetical protein